MKSCPNCNLYFNDGYACPQCGGALYDQDPYAQQGAYPQDPTQYNPYAAPTGYMPPAAPYDQTQAHPQQGYDYASGAPNAPLQQPYAAPQAYPEAPSQTLPAAEPSYAEPAAPSLPTVTTAPAAAAVPAKKTHHVRSAILIILALIVTSVASIFIYQALNNQADQEVAELEGAIVNSAWIWQKSVDDVLASMDDTVNQLSAQTQANAAAQTAPAPAADAAATDAAATDAAATEAAGEGAQPTTPEAAATEAAEPTPEATTTEAAPTTDAPAPADTADETAPQADATAAEGDDAAAPVSEEEAAALAEAQALAAGADQAPEAAAAQQALQANEGIARLLEDALVLQSLISDSQIQAIDQPMQVLAQAHPDLVAAWSSLRDVVTNFDDESMGIGADSANASAQGAPAAGTEAAATPNATGTEATALDQNAWQTFVEEFRAAKDAFMQAANDAGFSLS